MSEDHIPFSDLNFDDPVDKSHVENCGECRREWTVFRFLGFQIRSIPRLNAPPFFAPRVARIAQSTMAPFAFLLQKTAKQLIPAFVALILATSFLLYQLTEKEPVEYYSEVLFEEPVQEDFSLEYVINSLTETTEEESSAGEPQ